MQQHANAITIDLKVYLAVVGRVSVFEQTDKHYYYIVNSLLGTYAVVANSKIVIAIKRRDLITKAPTCLSKHKNLKGLPAADITTNHDAN